MKKEFYPDPAKQGQGVILSRKIILFFFSTKVLSFKQLPKNIWG